MKIVNLENENRKFIKTVNNFHVLEYIQDASVSPMNAQTEYFMSQMNVRRRQIVIELDKEHSAIIQAGAIRWMGGDIQATTGVKGIGDLFGKALKGCCHQGDRHQNQNMSAMAIWFWSLPINTFF